MVRTYPPHMNQIQAEAAQPCLPGYALCTQCDLKITELFSYRIKQAWYYV